MQHLPFLAELVVTAEMFNQKFHKQKHIKSNTWNCNTFF